MKTLHLFKDYQFTRTIDDAGTVPMLSALNDFQRAEATTEPVVFTVLDPKDGFAFSQRYQREADYATSKRVRWGTMFKHEAGLQNPGDIPSFDTLMERVKAANQLVKDNPEVEAAFRQAMKDSHGQPFLFDHQLEMTVHEAREAIHAMRHAND